MKKDALLTYILVLKSNHAKKKKKVKHVITVGHSEISVIYKR